MTDNQYEQQLYQRALNSGYQQEALQGIFHGQVAICAYCCNAIKLPGDFAGNQMAVNDHFRTHDGILSLLVNKVTTVPIQAQE